MVVEAALRARFGVISRPDAAIQGMDRLTIGQRLARQPRAQHRLVEPALAQGGVEAPPTAAVGGHEAEVDGRGRGVGRQQGIDEIKEGIPAVREAGVHIVAEVAQRDRTRVHARKCATSAGRAATVRPHGHPRVKSQA